VRERGELAGGMNGDPLEGCRAKIERAKEHFHVLYREYAEFFADGPFDFANYNNPAAGETVYLAKISRQPPMRWGILAGEIVHQLRSALDLLAWQLVCDGGGDPRTGPGGTGFPICKTPDGYEQSSRVKLKGASENAVRAIENIQPYNKPEDIGRLLLLLHELDIRDKHQVLNVAVGAFRGGVVTYSNLAEEVKVLQYKAEPHVPVASIKDGDVLLRHPMRGSESEPGASGRFNFGVAFEHSGPANGEPLVTTLSLLVQAMDQLMTMFRPLFKGHALYETLEDPKPDL
jgi:hypothetical protein